MPEIMLPEGIEIPDGSVPGDTIEVLASIKLGEEGKAEIVALDGLTIPGYEEGEEEGEEMEEEEEGAEVQMPSNEVEMMRRQRMAQGSPFVQAALGM